MSDCRQCADFEWCMEYEECGLFKQKPKTHYDEIRAMSIEELADMFSILSCCSEKGQDCMKYSDGMGGRNCYQCWLDWLKDEVSDEA